MRSLASLSGPRRLARARRLSTGALVVVLPLLFATCELDKLVTPPETGLLTVAPDTLADSAVVGSTALRSVPLELMPEGTSSLGWQASTVGGSAWLGFATTNGTAPDTLTVQLDPTGLAVGTYHDTLVMSSSNSDAAPTRVPVTFTIVPCRESAVALDTLIGGALTPADCASPTHPGRFARRFRFDADAGDSLSVVLQATGFSGLVVVDTIIETAACGGTTGDPCLHYLRLPDARSYVVEVTSGAAGETGAFTLSLHRPRAPAAPDTLAQLRADSVTAIAMGGATPQLAAVFRARLSDPDGVDTLRLEVELQPVANAFSGAATRTGGPVAIAGRGYVAVSPLGDDVSFHWQARTRDQTGRLSPWVTFGGNADLPLPAAMDFRTLVPQAPAVPAALAQFKGDGVTTMVVGDTNETRSAVFRAQVNDPDPGDQIRLEVEVKAVGTAFDSTGIVPSAAVTSGGTASVTVSGLLDNTAYHWRARAVDVSNTASAWVSFGGNLEAAADFRVVIPATQLVFTVQPQAAVAGNAITPPVEVRAQDGIGQTVPSFTGSVTIALDSNPAGGTLTGTTTVTAIAGVATFSNLRLNKAGPGYKLRATATALLATSDTFSIVPGAPASLAFTGQPTTAAAGDSIKPPVAVTVRDAQGNTVTSFTDTVRITFGSNPGSGTLSGRDSVAAVNGVATFVDLSIDKTGTGYTLTANAAALPPATSLPFDIVPQGTAHFEFTVQPTDGVAGQALTPAVVVTAKDGLGNTVTAFNGAVAMAIGANPAGGMLSGTPSAIAVNGVATFSNLRIDKAGAGYTLLAGAPGVNTGTSQAFDIAPGAAAVLAFTVGPQTTAAGAVLQPAIQVAARDAFGNAAPSFTDSVTIALGSNPAGGALAGTVRVAAVNGIATFADLSIAKAGTGYTLAATAPGLTQAASGVFDITAGPATSLAFTVEPSATPAGSPITPAVQVSARDAQGNVATSYAGPVTVALLPHASGASLGGTTTTTASSGVATFADLAVDKAGAGFNLTAADGGLAGDTSVAFAVTPGAAGRLAIVTPPPANAQSGIAFAPQPAVQVQDNSGNPVAQPGLTVTASVSAGPPGSTVFNATATTDGAGLATFAGLGLSGLVGNYTLTFTSPGLTPVSAGPIALAPGNAAKLVVTTQPAAVAQSGVQFGQQPVVQITDSAGNPVASAGITVAATLASGGGTLAGTNPITTDGAGMAVFTDLAIAGTVGPRALEFAAPGLAAVTSTTIDLQAGLAATLLLHAGDGDSATAGTAVAVPPAARAVDASGNPVAGVNVTFAVLSGGGTVTPLTPVATGSNGVAAAGTWTLGTTAGKNELTADAPGLAGSPVTFTATATVGAPVGIVKTGGDNLTGPVLSTLGTPHEVTVRDANGNGVDSVVVSWAAVGGSVTPTLDTTDALGRSTAIRTLGAIAGNQTTTATALIPGTPSVTFDITATSGGASQMVADSGDGQADTVGQTLPLPLVVRVTDASNNPVANVLVTWDVTLGNGCVGGTCLDPDTSRTDAQGRARITWTLGPLTNAQSVRATAAGAPVNFQATALPGPVSAAQSSVTAAPGAITASNGSSASTITVTARDANGNVVPNASVVLAATGGNNTLTQPAGPTNGAGQATGTITSTLAEVKAVSATINGTAVTQQASVTVAPAGAAQLFIQQQPTAAQAGAAIAPAPAVQIRDAFGNLVGAATNQVTMTLNPHASGGTLSGTNAVMAVAGVATFTDLSVNKTGTGYSLQVSATLSGSPVSLATAAFDITPAAATSIALVSGSGQTDTVAATLAQPFVVRVTDAFGNGVPGAAVTWTSLSGGGTLTPSGPTDVNGLASATRTLGTVAGPHTSQASVAGLTGSPVAFNSTANPATPVALLFTAQPAGATAGVAIAPPVQLAVKDQFGNTVTTPSRPVAVALLANPGGGTLSGTIPQSTTSGVASFADLSVDKAAAGYTLLATTAGLASDTSAAFTITAASVSASQSTVVVAPGTITASNGASQSTITVTARDAFNNPVAGASVVLAATGAGNTLTQPLGTTDAAGVATGTLSSITAGIKTVSATIGGTAVTQTAAVTVLPAAADHLAFRVQPANVVSGAAIAPAVEVTARDPFNNRDSTFTGTITITLGNNPGAAALTGTTSTAAVKGLAVFNDLHVDKAGAGYTLVASDGGPLVDTTSIGFNVAPAAATQLAFTVQPAGAAAGSAISPAVQVTARDGAGNRDTTFTGTIVVALGSNPGAATLNGTLSVAAVAGVASFPDLSLNAAAAGYTLTATSGALTQATSTAFTIAPATATALFFTVQPSNATAGAAIAPPIQVTARDQFGNTATGFVGSVTLDTVSHAGGAALNGTTTVAAAAGVATFNNVFINTAATGYTLKALAGGLNGDTSTTFDVSAGAATQLAFTVQPSAVTAGATIAPAVQVTVRDAQGNTVTGFVGTVTVAIGTNPGAGTLSGTTSQPVTSGVATFGDLSINRSGTGYTLTAAAATLTGATSAGFNVTPGAATILQVDASPGNTSAGATLTPTPLVSARDAQGNIVTAFTDTVVIAIASNPGGGTLAGTARVAAVGGVATFSGLSINKSSSGYTLAVTSGALTPDTTTAFTINPGSVAALVWDVQPVNPTVNAVITPSLRVRRVDAFGNTVPTPSRNILVTLSTNPTGATLAGTANRSTATAGADTGVAVFNDLSINLVGSGYVLSAQQTQGPVVPIVTTAPFSVVAGSATQLAFTTQPSTVNAGAAISPAVVVTARDQFNNMATGFTGPVTVAIGTNGGGTGVLSGTLTVNAVAGVATFSNLSLDKVGTGYTLTAASTALTGATSSAFNVTPGAATRVVFTQEPTNVVAGAAFSPTVQVAARDSLGNLVTGFTGGITVAIANNVNGATLGGNVTVTAASGVASFPTVFLDKAGAGYTLTATSGSLLPDTSAAFTVSPSTVSATHSSVQTGAATITASSGAGASTITVTARDSFDNAIPGAAVTLAASGTNNAFTAGGTGTTNGSGVFTSDFSSTKAEGKTISAAINGVGIAQTAAVTVAPDAPASIAATTATTQTDTAGFPVAIPPAVVVQDQFANPVPGVNVTFAVTAGGGSVVPLTPVTTDNQGGAAATSWTLGQTAGTNTLSATAAGGGITGNPVTFTATGVAGVVSAAQSTVAAAPDSILASSGTSQSTITVTARDQFGNPVPGAAVVLAATGSNNALTQPAGATNASGVATGTLSSTTAEAKTVSATAGGVAVSQQAPVTVTPAAVSAAQSSLAAAPDTITASSGANQSSVTVTARDQFGNAIAGATVVLAAPGATVVQPAGPTGSNGVASGAIHATAAGDKIVSATINGTGVTQTDTVTVTAATASQLAVSAGDGQSATVGAAVATPPAVLVSDAFNNPVPGFSVTFTVTGGGGSVTGSPAITDGAGIATLGSWTLGNTAGANTLDATGSGVPTVQFTATGLTAGVSASQSSVVAAPGTITASNGASQSTITVTARDQFNNPIQGATVVLASTGSSNALTQPLGTTDGAGVATGTISSTTAELKRLSATIAGVAITQQATVTVTPAAVSAAQTTLDAAPDTIAASLGATQSTITVTARDQFDNPIAGATVVLAATGLGNTLTQPPGTTSAAGVATGTLSSTLIGDKVVSAQVDGTPITQLDTVTVTPAAVSAANSSVGASPSILAASAGGVTSTVTVTARDAFNNPVANATVVVSATGTGNTITGPAAPTNASGVATATLSSTVAESKTVSASAAGVGITQNSLVIVQPAAAAQMKDTAGNGQSATVGTAVATPPAAVVRDAFNNPVPNFSVTFTVTGGGGSVTGSPATTDAAGVATLGSWTLGTTAGANTLDATGSGVATVQFTATGTAGAATTIAAVSGGGQSDTAGATLPLPLVVLVTDASGNGVPGVTVTWSVTGGGGSITGTATSTTSITDNTGHAQATRTLGTGAGPQSAQAAAGSGGGLTGSPVVFGSTATAATAAQITATTSVSQTDTAGLPVAQVPAVHVIDQFGNPKGGVTVTFQVTAGAGTTSPASPAAIVTDLNGDAALTSWTLDQTAGTNAVTATATGSGISGNPVLFSATGVAGAASATLSTLAATPDTITASSGASQSTITVAVRDQFNNPIQGATVVLAAPGATVVQPAGPTGSNGVATGAVHATAAGDKIVSATIGSTGITQTDTVTVTAAAATQMAVSAGDGQSATVGTAVAVDPAVLVLDAFNNPVPSFSVTFTVTGGGGSVTGSPATTDAAGVATLGSWTLGNTAGANTLDATGSGVPTVQFTATGTAGAATTITATTSVSQTDTAGFPVAQAPAVHIADQFGNPKSGVAVTFAVTQGAGSISPSPANLTTDLSGNAALTSWTLDQTAGANAVTATATGSGISGNPVLFSATGVAGAASATLSTLTATPDTITASNGLLQSTVTVTARDQFSNVIPGASVVLNATGASPDLTQPAGPTNGAGVATGSLSSTKKGNKQVSATVDGVPLTQTHQVHVKPGPASATHSLIVAIPDTITASNGSSQATITITARDEFDNTIPGATAVLSTTPGAHTFSQPAATDTGGVTSGLFHATSAGTRTINVTVDGVAVTATAAVTVVPAAAASLTFTAGPSNISAGTSFPSLEVTAHDAFGNVATGFGGNVTIAISSGTGTVGANLLGTATAAASGGVATFSLSVDSVGTAYTLEATAGGVTGATSNAFDVTPGAAASIEFSQQPGNGTTLTPLSPQPQVTVRDGFGNVVTNYSGNVVMTIENDASPLGDAQLTGTATEAVSNGVAAFTDLGIDRTGVGSYTLRATAGSLFVISAAFLVL